MGLFFFFYENYYLYKKWPSTYFLETMLNFLFYIMSFLLKFNKN